MFKSYLAFWKNYVNFEGTTTRSDYWLAILLHFIIYVSLIFGAIFFSAVTAFRVSDFSFSVTIALMAVLLLYSLAIFIPSLSIMVRRLRDAGFHWALMFLQLIPFGGFVLFVLTCLPSKVTSDYQEQIYDAPTFSDDDDDFSDVEF
ncbi:uncharacterized membrane protein YhaH (DUF805 family) [Enterococcus sp. PF1-24]|uniref:DUF805 domain-containing protein n=1 Tax=unclassified Enterococcus TaxID=2608891 RepID=UPI0024758FEE|nr:MULTISPECIES: DUF805 domain-containing protein [unclassified Enterococcus]MDH6364879.1 uncharacterized membrane protein YhaH (DUF805 family) [Enterococcus sp. PFB1-1]MDH6401980.1 uncharacterized membrane protein YhaH (DUF805 family) [Enterococcus sp. PF1-24]